MFRVILAAFAWEYLKHWPETWTSDAWIAMGLILFALPISDLAAKVPASEAVEALQAIMVSFSAKSTAGAAERLHTAYGRRETQLPGQGDVPDPEEK